MSECEDATSELAVLDTHGSLADIPSSSDEIPLLPTGHQWESLDDIHTWRQRHQQVINDAAILMLEKVEEVEPQWRRPFVASLQSMIIMEMKEAARLLLLFVGKLPDAPEGPDELSRDEEVQLSANVEDAFSKLQALSEMAWVGQDVDEVPHGGSALEAHQMAAHLVILNEVIACGRHMRRICTRSPVMMIEMEVGRPTVWKRSHNVKTNVAPKTRPAPLVIWGRLLQPKTWTCASQICSRLKSSRIQKK